ncbi:MAG: nucleotidyltransferase family protein [Oscillospiraceae bacterium]|nr:nucleotidyltransferase family protein [Oscillospiraceae bacterium]
MESGISVGCVILAAGNGMRFGQNKLLAEFRGKPLIQWTMETVPRELIRHAAVVTQYQTVAELAEGFGFRVVWNPAPELGISHSVCLGTEAMEQVCKGLAFLVADQPLLRRETVARLIEAFHRNPDRIIVPAAEGRQGNPCVFPAALFPALEALEGDRGGKQIIRRHPELVTEIQVEPIELLDVDTASDLKSLPLQNPSH